MNQFLKPKATEPARAEPPPVDLPQPEPPAFVPTLETPATQQPVVKGRVWRLWHLYGSLALGALVFFTLGSYSAFTAEQLNPGQVIFNSSLTPTFMAGAKAALIPLMALVILRLFWKELHEYFRSDKQTGIDLNSDLKAVTPAVRLWLFVTVFFGFCYLLALLFTAKLPESVSVGP